MAIEGKGLNEYTYTTVNQDPAKSIGKFEKEVENAPSIGIRHLQTFLCFTLGFVAFGFRVCLSVGIVAMTDPTVSSNPDIPTYPEWHNKNVILSAFFWGYVLPQVFAAYVAKRYGPKYFLIGTMVIQSILSFLTPITASHFGETGMIISRAVQGLCQGFIFPSCTHLLSQWVPPQERSRLGSIVFTGLLVPAAALIALGYTSPDQPSQAVLLLIISVGFNAACFSGFAINHMDLSPNHAGTLMGLINGISQITAVISPLLVQILVTNIRDSLEWRYVFFLAAISNIISSTIYVIFGSGEIQPWNTEENDEEDKENQM